MCAEFKPKPFRIAIIGAGIGGLGLAAALGRYVRSGSASVHISLYESASEIPTIGAGIAIWPRTWEILSLLGLEDAMQGSTAQMGGILIRRSDRTPGRDAYAVKFDCKLRPMRQT